MNRYILIRRLRGPAFLLLVGVIALLNEADILSWGHAWPLFLILAGVLQLAERGAMSSEGFYPPNPGAQYPYGTPGAQAGTPAAEAGTSIVPAHTNDYDNRGGQS